MKLFNELGIDGSYFIIGILCGLVILLIIVIILYMQLKKLKTNYSEFMTGSDGRDLESSILSRFKMIDNLKEETKNIKLSIDNISEVLLSSYQNVSLVKYDAFKEMGGKLSFTLCMLDAKKNGFLLTSMHSSREGCYTYIKEIINGESYVLLSEEEKKALSDAKEKSLGRI